MEAKKTKNEPKRIQVLRSYKILDTLPEQLYDDLTLLATEICDVPIALISLVDKDRQWFKSKQGVSVNETPRNISICTHAILEPDEIFVVSDALLDERFVKNPFVSSEPKIRFYAGVPLKTDEGIPLGTLCVIDRRPKHLSKKQKTSLKALSRQVMALLDLHKSLIDINEKKKELENYHVKLEKYQKSLEETNSSLKIQSVTDPLTGLRNRRVLNEQLDDEFLRFKRNGSTYSILIIDIDHFKSINDEFGHLVGDSILKDVTKIIKDTCRTSDFAYRYGGEEFAVLLPDTGIDGAIIMGERIRKNIESNDWKHNSITISVGTSTVDYSITSSSQLLQLADNALYQAKERGRNQVVFANDLQEEIEVVF